MKEILKSDKIRLIEEKSGSDIKNLLHDLHFVRDFKHKQIAWLLDVPRPTITRWFRQFDLPTRSCRRFTDQNLKSWLYKTGRLKKRIVYKGPDKRIQRTKGNVNINFFRSWSPEMAYVLGFFAADGGMFINSGGSKYIQFVSTDKEILIKIKKLMNSNHKIGIKKRNPEICGWKDCYLMQIGSKEMYGDLLKLGFTPKKDKTLKFPKVPYKYLSHFVRGHFDGDGSIVFGHYKRKNRNNKTALLILTSFVCGNREFLKELSKKLSSFAHLGKGSLKQKMNNNAYQLSYSINDSKKLFNFMYGDQNSFNRNFCLKRKYDKFIEAFRIKGA